MKIAKAEITDKKIFNKIKESLNRNSYVECGLCGAIRVEAYELARVVHSFIVHVEKGNGNLSYLCSDILEQIIVSAPDDLEGYVEFLKSKAANDTWASHFRDADGYVRQIYGCYDDLVIFDDPSCDCFGKEKIKNEIDC